MPHPKPYCTRSNRDPAAAPGLTPSSAWAPELSGHKLLTNPPQVAYVGTFYLRVLLATPLRGHEWFNFCAHSR